MALLANTGRNRVKTRAHIGSKRRNASRDDNRDQRGDQTIFDGSRAGRVFRQLLEEFFMTNTLVTPC
jgi:hypothetical protein